MSHARDNVDRIFPELRALCPAVPLPSVVRVEDEPAGDFGVATAGGWNSYEGRYFVSFDEGYEPLDHNVAHEGGHLADSVVRVRFGDGPMLERYWQARGFPGTAQWWAEEHVRRGGAMTWAGWSVSPLERFAETLACLWDGTVIERGETWGVPLDDARRATMRAFFASLPDAATLSQPAPTPVVAPSAPEPAPTMYFDDPVGHLLGLVVTRGFGDRSFPQYGVHDGLDLAPRAGQADTPLYAIADGVVGVDDDDARFVTTDPRTWGGVGVVVRQDDGVEVGFWHMAPPNLVTRGQRVRRGQLVGYIGRTGAATGIHVHVGVRRNGVAIDPLAYLEEEADMAFTEEDRARMKRIEEKIDRGFRVLAAVWLQRLFYGRNPWTGKTKAEGDQAPAYTAPPPGWVDPGI